MKKRTKIELIIFAVVAVFYLASLFMESSRSGDASDGSIPQAELSASDDNGSAESYASGAETYDDETADLAEEGEDSDKAAESDDHAWKPANISDYDIESKAENGESLSVGETAAYFGGVQVPETEYSRDSEESRDSVSTVSEDGSYTDKDSVALYIATYGHLPDNFITKNEAKAAGWVSSEGNLSEVCPGKSIGGDKFGNYESKLPTANNRKYYECDINYDQNKGYRGSERIIYSNDGLIYYTNDHYETFELLYGEP